MNAKIFGYIISALGLLAIAISTPKIMSSTPLLSSIPISFSKYILIGGVIIIGVGVVLVMSTSQEKTKLGKEVPIYKGKKIIGYRIEGWINFFVIKINKTYRHFNLIR